MINITRINYLFKETQKKIDKKEKIEAIQLMRKIEEAIVDSFNLSLVFSSKCDEINYLFDNDFITYYQKDILHKVRMIGNEAVHNHTSHLSNNQIQMLLNELKNVYQAICLKEKKRANEENKEVYEETNNDSFNGILITCIIVVAIILMFYVFIKIVFKY